VQRITTHITEPRIIMKKIAALAATTALLVTAGTSAASAREPRPGDHRGRDHGAVKVVEAPETDPADVEAPEVEAPEVEAPEVEAPEVAAPEDAAPIGGAPEGEAPEI